MTSSNRRDFLKILGAASAGAVLAPSVFTQRRRRSCVVVGSGLAGLSAAFKLKNSGWDVTVLEARGRTGGRVFSHVMPNSGGLICELGAEWIGESHERIRQLCSDFKIGIQKHQFSDHLLQNGIHSRPGAWDYSPKAKAAFDRMVKGFEKLTDAQQRRLDRKDWWTHLSDIGFTREDLILRDLADSTDFGESIRHVSAFGALAEYAENDPEKTQNQMDYKVIGGNSRLVDEFVARVGRDNIRTGMKVTEINQRGGIVTVKAGNETFRADACICTTPVASLRKIKFNPPLPAAQRDAAEKLIYARIVKNSVLYEDRFWKDDDFSMVTDTTSHYYFHSTQKQAGNMGILTAYAIGEKADVLASQDDPRRMNVITRDLVDFDQQAPSLARGIASYAWQRDEFTEGAYALYKPGQWFGIRPTLKRPHGKVLFAGEHLADWQGFMEGAINTGEHAAGSLIR
ncbi:MAG: FAD-dependent oxidoreductase [Pyrinomonadaceae bacterium]|nr:FAD-dependent oxidoreductase [Pyrinomonadaceae bacterium]